MADQKFETLEIGEVPPDKEKELELEPDQAETQQEAVQQPEPKRKTLAEILFKGTEDEIKQRFVEEVQLMDAVGGMILEKYQCLAILEPSDSIDNFELDRIFQSLRNQNKQRDVLLILLSRGGSIEPAYQISKLCKAHAKGRFIVIIPRFAKSAATLIALGADEIHMGPLGQLGPIDPQIKGLPALGVNQALRTIAAVSQDYPKSANMLAMYLQKVLTVEQIGYCNRICDSAEQYAVRLLSTKTLERKAPLIAKELVHEYKDHSFVIDVDEARQHLGASWVKSDTPELEFAEKLYSLFEFFNFFLAPRRRLVVIGSLEAADTCLLWTNE